MFPNFIRPKRSPLAVAAVMLLGAGSVALADSPPADWLASAQEEIRRSEYRFSSLGEGVWSAPNRAQDLRSRLSANGLEVVRRTSTGGGSDRAFRMRWSRFGRAGDLEVVGDAPPNLASDRLEIRRDGLGLVEWYLNDERGIEQGFSIERAPRGGVESGPVVLEMAVPDGWRVRLEEGGHSLLFETAGAGEVFRYSGLRAWDATGRALSAELAVSSRGIEIRVDDAGAAYPLTVDPLLTLADWSAKGGRGNAQFGFSVASAGDVNRDGYGDVIIGAPFFDEGGVDQGKVFVYYGSAAGLPALPSWTAASDQPDAQFGYSVASAGNVNMEVGGPYDDIIVGAPFYDTAGGDDRGRIFVWHGSATGLVAEGGTPANASWNADAGQPQSRFGWSVASAGDANADNLSEIVAGAPGFNNPEADEGMIFVWFGSASPMGLGLNGTFLNADWKAESNEPDAQIGYSVASAGRVNNDPWADVIAGAPFYNDRGFAFIWFGNIRVIAGGNGFPGNASWSAEGQEPNAQFGWSVASAGSVNGDAFSDVIIGAPLYDSLAGTDRGAAFLWHGAIAIPGPPGTPGNASWRAEWAEPSAQFGHSVAAAGDVDADGFGDIIIGAPLYDHGTGDNRGGAFVWHGSIAGLGDFGTPANADWAAEGGGAGARFGHAVAAAGDVDKDGLKDVIIGANAQSIAFAAEGAAYVYRGFDPPDFLEFGPEGDARRVEASIIGYTELTGLASGEFMISGSASVKMGDCALPPECTRSFPFTDLTAVNDPDDLSSTGEPAFRIVGGTANVDIVALPILFPGAADLAYRLHEFNLGAAGADVPVGGMRLALPGNMTSDAGEDLALPAAFPIEQDLDFSVSILTGGMFWFGPRDYPFQIFPRAETAYLADRDLFSLGISDLVYVANETGDAELPGADTRCSISGACQDEDNDAIFGLGWDLNQYAAVVPPAGSIGTPYFDRNGLRATLYLLDDGGGTGGSYPLLFPDGATLTLTAASSIEIDAGEPGGGSLSGSLGLEMRTGAVIVKGSVDGVPDIDEDCHGDQTIIASFTGGRLLAGGQIRIDTLSGPSEIHWGGPQDPEASRRGFYAAGLDAASLSFYAPGTAARVTVARPTVTDHLLAEQDDGDRTERGTYAGLNIGASGTTGMDSDCPAPALPDHSLAVASTETRLYARRSGVSGIADAGRFVAPGLPFEYMGYEMTIGRYGVTFLDNVVEESGVVVNSVVIPSPSDVQFYFGSPAEITSCGSFGSDLGEMVNAGTPQQLACWKADFTPQAAGFRPADPPGGLCQPAAPEICPSLDDDDVRYLHVSSTAPLDLDSQKPAAGDWSPRSEHFLDIVSMDFTPDPDGPLVCSDIIPVGISGSVRNELNPGYGFGIDLSHAHLMPLNPTCNAGAGPGPEVADADEPRYDVVGEYLFPFYGGTAGCTRVVQGALGTRADCGDPDEKIRVTRKVLGGLIDLDYLVSYFPPVTDDGSVNDLETAGRFVAESAKLDFKFFELPASIKLFGDLPDLPGLPAGVPRQQPEMYLGFLSDLSGYAEARAPDGTCGPTCTATLHDLVKFGLEESLDVDDVLPSLRAGAAKLGGNLRTMAADAMRDSVGDLLPADMALAAGRVKGAVDGIRKASGALEPFKLLNLTGPGSFRPTTDDDTVKDWVLDRIDIAGDIDILDFVKFKGFVRFNAHTANTADDEPGDDASDVTVGAENVDLGWIIDGVKARTVEATFLYDPPTLDDPLGFRVFGFDGRIDVGGLKFGDVIFDELGFLVGMGRKPSDLDDDYYYLAGLGRGKYKAATAAGGFFIGKSYDIAPLERIDPDVAEILEGLDSLTGIYARAEASFPVFGGSECFPYRLTAGGGAAFWLFSEGPTFGAKLRVYATGSLACVVSARADMTLLGGLTDDVWHLRGYGFAAGGIGLCEPTDWDTRRDVLRDDWCAACVLDGEFSTDSERNDLQGQLDGPDCSGF